MFCLPCQYGVSNHFPRRVTAVYTHSLPLLFLLISNISPNSSNSLQKHPGQWSLGKYIPVASFCCVLLCLVITDVYPCLSFTSLVRGWSRNRPSDGAAYRGKWVNTSYWPIKTDNAIIATKIATKPYAYFAGYTVYNGTFCKTTSHQTVGILSTSLGETDRDILTHSITPWKVD